MGFFLQPQSNQRGIETVGGLEGLAGALEPQSNQRGIETGDLVLEQETQACASIEPAWD